ncbi:hypothetical protein QQF64_029128 [Cirrhinus molitorella]|uniref:Uncharacterized protein n=1 Tax=Cirrhinus molitorella TaxID=172907 RepID=A0ABR3N8I3_9TELE
MVHVYQLMRRREVECRKRDEEEKGLSQQLLYLSPFPHPVRKFKEQWMKVRNKGWWSRIVLTEFTDVEWRENFFCKAVWPGAGLHIPR